MKLIASIAACALVGGLLLPGCTYQRHVVLEPAGVPERIYAAPLHNGHTSSRVAVFTFREPPYAPGAGRQASESLYEELLRRAVFLSVTLESDISDVGTESLIEMARNKDYDLIITGDVLYYFEGSLHQPSRVDERIRVIEVDTHKTLWYAKTIDVGQPTPDTDYFLAQGRGLPAPTTTTLLMRNAEKFCNMLLDLPQEPVPATTKPPPPGTYAPDQEPAEDLFSDSLLDS